MSERDVQVVETLISPMSEEAKSSARVLLTCFRLPYKVKHHWEATGRRNLSLPIKDTRGPQPLLPRRLPRRVRAPATRAGAWDQQPG